MLGHRHVRCIRPMSSGSKPPIVRNKQHRRDTKNKAMDATTYGWTNVVPSVTVPVPTDEPEIKDRLMFWPPPRRVVFYSRWMDPTAAEMTMEIAEWVRSELVKYYTQMTGTSDVLITVFASTSTSEENGRTCRILRQPDKSGQPVDSVQELCPDQADSAAAAALSTADLVITVGGDGTILHAISAGRGYGGIETGFPPLLSFGAGSVRFLSAFEPLKYKTILSDLMFTGVGLYCSSRMRIKCAFGSSIDESEEAEVELDKPEDRCIVDGLDGNKEDKRVLGAAAAMAYNPNRPLHIFGGQDSSSTSYGSGQHHVTPIHVLNEVSIKSEGVGSFICELDGYQFSILQGDGVLIATPTGSTAYSLSAGGPIVTPLLSAYIFTPLAPLSLSARTLVLPATSTLKITVHPQSRHAADVVFDGVIGNSHKLQPGQWIEVTNSPHPIIMADVAHGKGSFINNVTSKLRWNSRWKGLLDTEDSQEPKPEDGGD